MTRFIFLWLLLFISSVSWADCLIPPYIQECPGCPGSGTCTNTCTISTSTSTSAFSVASAVPTLIQSETVREGESLAISTPPNHGSASLVNSGTGVSYTSSVGYQGGDTVVTQFVSLSYQCQEIKIGDVVIGTNRGINTNTDTKTISLTVNPSPTSIPTLSEWAQILLALSLLGMAGWYWQRRAS